MRWIIKRCPENPLKLGDEWAKLKSSKLALWIDYLFINFAQKTHGFKGGMNGQDLNLSMEYHETRMSDGL